MEKTPKEYRLIKFRAWDKTRKQMNYKVLVGNTDTSDKNYTCNSVLVDGEWMNADDICINLMQFTGLLDSQSQEVYEGDILEHTHGYGSICIKDSEGKMWIGHGETYLANTLIQNYQKGDTIK